MTTMERSIRRGFTLAADMVVPLRCQECDSLFDRRWPRYCPPRQGDIQQDFDHLMAGFLCPDCRRSFVAIQSPMCTLCGLPFASSNTQDHMCGACQAKVPEFDKARSTGSYETVLRTLIHRFKYQGCVQLSAPLGLLLWMVFRTHWDPDQVDAILPIPLHPRRQRDRGFNQAFQLIRRWPRLAAKHGIQLDKRKIRPALLRRRHQVRPQMGLNRRQRAENVKDAFILADAADVTGRNVLLVDDVLTTGATAQACARLLKLAGAARVDVLTLARAAVSFS